MKLKILAVAILSVLIVSALTSVGYETDENNTISTINYEKQTKIFSNNEQETVDIHIAIYTDEKETDEDFYSPIGRTRYFIYALRDYSWKVGDITYNLVPSLLSMKDVLKGELTKENYDVLLAAPEHAMGKVFSTGFSKTLKNKKIRNNIVNFIEEGGGYFGTCAGAEIAGNAINTPETFFEKMWTKSCLGISVTKHEFHMGTPIFCQWLGFGAEAVDVVGYIQYSGFDSNDPNINYHNGACLDVKIENNHPIFNDYLENSRKIRWVSGPALMIPDSTDREISAIARFPDEEISENESLKVHHWKYDGGIRGLTKAFFKSFKSDVSLDYFGGFGLGNLFYAFVYAEDWDMLEDKIIETDFANKPFMVSEIYPNQNNARLVLCTGHPEMNVWWGGHIEEVEDTDHNSIFDSFHHWVDIIPEDETSEDEFSYNYWIIQRSIAYASQKVPDNDLPPVYGPSQVCDFGSYKQPSSFTITANMKTSDGVSSMDLYYQYSFDNESWSDWILYDTDTDSSNGWSWEFISPNGIGYYEFYSIRHVEYEGYVETEKVPPGPDAIVHVSGLT